MKILLVSDDTWLSIAIRSRMKIEWTGDSTSFIFDAHSCRKLIILVDDRMQRRDYLRIKEAYPDNVFIVWLRLSRKEVHLPVGVVAYEVDVRCSAGFFFRQLQDIKRNIELHEVYGSMPLRLTETEKKVTGFLSRGLTVSTIAKILGLSEKGVLNHCYAVAKKYGFSNLAFFRTFMFSDGSGKVSVKDAPLSGGYKSSEMVTG